MGYKGYNLADPPSLTESAKQFLKDHPVETFYERYGEYFIVGVQRGASATINL